MPRNPRIATPTPARKGSSAITVSIHTVTEFPTAPRRTEPSRTFTCAAVLLRIRSAKYAAATANSTPAIHA